MYFLFYYLFLATLGLHGYTRAFSSCSEQGLLSSCGGRASRCSGFSCYRAQALETGLPQCGEWTQLVHSMWNLPRPGIKPVATALAGRLFTTHWTTREVHSHVFLTDSI